MMNQQDQESIYINTRNLFGPFLHILNPIEQIRFQYFARGWSIPTYMNMMRTGHFAPAPFWALSPLLQRWAAKAPTDPFWKKGISVLIGRPLAGSDAIMDYVLQGNKMLIKTADRRTLSKLIAKTIRAEIKPQHTPEQLQKVATKLAAEIAKRAPEGSKLLGALNEKGYNDLAKLVGRTSTMMRIGAIVNPVLVGLSIASLVRVGAVLSYKLAQGFTTFMRNNYERSQALEFGGLSAGFVSFGAMTERQRAVQEMNGSLLSGRRYLGQEASLYAYL